VIGWSGQRALAVAYKWHVLLVMVVGTFMVMLDTTVINVALPTIMNDLDATLGRAQLVISMYLLAIALVIPLTGFLADKFGTKRLYTMCIVGFTLTSALCGLAFDYKGFILAGIGFSTALLALTRVAEDGWTSTTVLGMFMVSAVALVCWVIVELREETPLLDLRIFKNFTYTMAAIVYLVSTLILFSALFLLPVFLQNVRGLSPIETGLFLMPEAAAMAVSVMVAGRLYDKIGPAPLMIPGLLGLFYSMWLLHGLDVTTSDADLVKILFLRGVSIGFMAMPAFTLVFGVHAPEAMARASALTNVLRQVIPAFGIALFATLLQTRTAFHFSRLAQTITPDSLEAV